MVRNKWNKCVLNSCLSLCVFLTSFVVGMFLIIIKKEIVSNNETVIVVLENRVSNLRFIESMVVHIIDSSESTQRFLIEFLILHACILIEYLNVERHILSQPRVQPQLVEFNTFNRVRSQHSLNNVVCFRRKEPWNREITLYKNPNQTTIFTLSDLEEWEKSVCVSLQSKKKKEQEVPLIFL